MTDLEMYDLLCQKAENIKMRIDASLIAEIASRFKELSESSIDPEKIKQEAYKKGKEDSIEVVRKYYEDAKTDYRKNLRSADMWTIIEEIEKKNLD